MHRSRSRQAPVGKSSSRLRLSQPEKSQTNWSALRWEKCLDSLALWPARIATVNPWFFIFRRLKPFIEYRSQRHGIWQKVRQEQAQRKTQATKPAIQAQKVLPLHRSEGGAGGLQGCRHAEGLHPGKRQDHASTTDRYARALPAPSRYRDQTRSLPRAVAVHRSAQRLIKR